MKNTNTYKKLLEAEKKKLIKELETIGRKNPKVAGGWEAVTTDVDADNADDNVNADELEEYEDNEGILSKLDAQLGAVEQALKKIIDGTYGKCNVCGEEIPEERLKASPAAVTCIKHSK